MKRWLGVIFLVVSGCRNNQPCGWDEELSLGVSYDVELLELYTPESTMAFYLPGLDLTRPAPTCSALDGIDAGEVFTIRLTQAPGTNMRCSYWQGEFVSPSLDLGMRLPGLINNRSYNNLTISGHQDFGGGCVGNWEFLVHAPDSEPFAPQWPELTPELLVYRSFSTDIEANAACSALIGREPTTGGFFCGDAFVASMAPQ